MHLLQLCVFFVAYFCIYLSGIEAPSVQGGETLAVVWCRICFTSVSSMVWIDGRWHCMWRLRQHVIKNEGGDGDIDQVVSNNVDLIYHLLQHVDEDGREKNSSTEAEDKTWWISMWTRPDLHVMITSYNFAKRKNAHNVIADDLMSKLPTNFFSHLSRFFSILQKLVILRTEYFLLNI